LKPLEMLRALETSANVRIIDAGPDGWLVLPLDKVTNVDPPEAGKKSGVSITGR
jgi:hypothetical protein